MAGAAALGRNGPAPATYTVRLVFEVEASQDAVSALIDVLATVETTAGIRLVDSRVA